MHMCLGLPLEHVCLRKPHLPFPPVNALPLALHLEVGPCEVSTIHTWLLCRSCLGNHAAEISWVQHLVTHGDNVLVADILVLSLQLFCPLSHNCPMSLSCLGCTVTTVAGPHIVTSYQPLNQLWIFVMVFAVLRSFFGED